MSEKDSKEKQEVVRRKRKEPLTDAQLYSILDQYSQGVPVSQIASSVSRDANEVSKIIQKKLREMNAVRETNDLIIGTHTAQLKRQRGAAPSKFITSSFLSAIETQAEVYAYYYSQTGDNKFALIQSGLDVGIPKTMKKATKDYVYRIRGQYLRDIPIIAKYIREEQDKRIAEYRLEKPQVQMELVNQVEELKEVVVNEPRQRSNLLKAIELLGRSIGAFTDRVEVEETDAKSGLEILMEKVKGEVYEQKKE